MSERPSTSPIGSESSQEPAVPQATAALNFGQLLTAVRLGPVSCPGPTLTDDAVFLAGLLAEAGVTSVVIARWEPSHRPSSGETAGAMTDVQQTKPVPRTLLSRQTDLPRELALLPDDSRLIAGPMMVWRSGDHLVVALHESR